MKHVSRTLLTLTLAFPLAGTVRAGTLLDDHFLLGNRTTQNLTNSSAWFANSAGTLTNLIGTNTIGALNGVVPTTSCMWMTYFMPSGNPSALNIGDTLKVTMVFTNIGVSVNGNATTGIRIGLFNYAAGGVRIAADVFSTSGANGANVQGYATFLNFGQTFGIPNPISIRKRTTVTDANLLGTGNDYTTLGSGGGNSGDPGFTNGVQYTYEYSVTRNDVDMVTITNHIFGPNLDVETDTTDNSGTCTNFDCVAIRPANSVGCASNIVFTEFKVEGPPGLLTPPIMTSNPQDMTLTVSDFGTFSSAAGGSLPLSYQWYFNNTSTPLARQTNQNLTLFNIQSSQAGPYFVIVTNSQGSATSTMASLTVNTPVHTSRGLILDDTFQNSSRVVTVSPPTTSDWVASVNATLAQPNIPGALLGTTQTNTSTQWIGYFIDPFASAPVDLAVGDALRVTLVFYPTNIAPQNTSSLRFGVFDYFDGATPLFGDGDTTSPTWNGSAGGMNVRGYMLTVNFGTEFGDNTPLGIQVRTNLSSAGLMSATGDFLSLGSGPGGMSNAPAFSEASQYTLQLTAARTAATTMQVNAQITGNQLTNLSFTATDTNYFTHRFSAFAIRPNRPTDSATNLTFTEFKVEVVAASVLPFSITSTSFSQPHTFSLTWPSVTGKFYYVESTSALNPSAWVTNATVTATGSSTSWTNTSASGAAAFYRVLAPAQP